MTRPNEFTETTKEDALKRQGNRCASCGAKITALGNQGVAQHEYGEGAQAHHMKPVQYGGSAATGNCVIICQSCHYNVHEGGRYRSSTITSSRADYPFFNG